MDKFPGVPCEVCGGHLITLHWRHGSLIISIQCPECGEVESHSMDDLFERIGPEPEGEFEGFVITCPVSNSTH